MKLGQAYLSLLRLQQLKLHEWAVVIEFGTEGSENYFFVGVKLEGDRFFEQLEVFGSKIKTILARKARPVSESSELRPALKVNPLEIFESIRQNALNLFSGYLEISGDPVNFLIKEGRLKEENRLKILTEGFAFELCTKTNMGAEEYAQTIYSLHEAFKNL